MLNRPADVSYPSEWSRYVVITVSAMSVGKEEQLKYDNR